MPAASRGRAAVQRGIRHEGVQQRADQKHRDHGDKRQKDRHPDEKTRGFGHLIDPLIVAGRGRLSLMPGSLFSSMDEKCGGFPAIDDT